MSALSPRQMFLLDEACKPIFEAFGVPPYLVGTAGDLERKTYRDVDVRLILWDKEYDALLAATGPHTLVFLGMAIGQYLASRTDLPIDFQIQRQTEANARHKGIRDALGRLSLKDFRGDGAPKPAIAELESQLKTAGAVSTRNEGGVNSAEGSP